MTASVSRRRRPPKVDTERAAAQRACARHLKDLRRAHDAPPPDFAVSTRGVPKFVAPIEERSYITSPAELCAELADREPADGELADASQFVSTEFAE